MLLGRSWENLEILHTGVFSYSWGWIKLLLTQKLGRKIAIKWPENRVTDVQRFFFNLKIYVCLMSEDICMLEINIWVFVYVCVYKCTHTLICYVYLYMFQILRSPRSTWRNSSTSLAKNNIFRIKLVFCFCNLFWLIIFLNRRSYMFWRCCREFWFLLIELCYASSISSFPYSFGKCFHRLKLIMKILPILKRNQFWTS